MKVGELRSALEGVPDELEIVVRAWDDDGNDVCAALAGAEVQYAHDEVDTPYFALDAGPDDGEGEDEQADGDAAGEVADTIDALVDQGESEGEPAAKPTGGANP